MGSIATALFSSGIEYRKSSSLISARSTMTYLLSVHFD
jgi:hypothetical protein